MSSPRRRSAWAGSVAGPLAAALFVATPALAAVATDDQTQLVRVTQSSNDASTGWIEQAYDCTVDEPFTTPNQDYILGPGTPTLGAGSHVMRTGQYGEETELYRTGQFDGTKASDISHLSYATWASATKADNVKKEPAYLRLSFDTDGDSSPDTFLYYEPSISNTTTDDTWQNWNTLGAGQQWSNGGGQDAGSLTSFQDFASANPDATIANNGNGGGVALIAGCSGQNQENGLFGVDRFAITTASQSKLFDFDPSVTSVVSNVTVTNNDAHGWNAAAYNDSADITPDQSMAFGPGNPPAGIGSHRLSLGTDPNEVEIWRSPELDGINVGDIRTLNYSTYEKPGTNSVGVQQPAYMRLSIDPGDNSGQINLYYEPSINHSDGIANNSWQTWNTANELWSTDGGPDNLTTLAAVSAKHPNATVFTPANAAGNGGLSLVVGGSGDTQLNSDFYVDNVEADYFHGAQADTDRTFDFEPTVPTPTINVPGVVVGRSVITISGNTSVPNAPVTLFEKRYGAADFTAVANSTAGDDGSYSFHRTVSKRTSYYVRSYDRTNSATKTVKVRVAVGLTLSSPAEGKLRMAVTTSPRVPDQTVRFFKRNADGTHTLLATRTTGSRGGAHATINWPSGHRITVYATVTAPAGNLKGHSADESIRVT